jgi:selenocysteine lyase/cysteine desulfurase
MIELFPVKKKYLYFNFAADGPLPATARDAICDALQEKSLCGYMAVPKQIAVYEDIRDELSVLFKSRRDSFAFTKNTSEGVLLALLALDIKEDQNYIAAADAFPTTIKMMENNCKGQMRTVNINSPTPLVDQIRQVMDGQTRAIVLDWVHYFTGRVIDIAAIVELARGKNIFTIIDGIQGSGALALELDDSGIDFFVAGGHKWLLSPQGSGFIYASAGVWERIQRKSFGWLGYDWGDFSDFGIQPRLREGAAVMEYGTRPYITAVGFRECLRVINRVGIGNIQTHNRELKELFVEQITRKGYETILANNETSASIVPFRKKGGDSDSRELLNRLQEKQVVLALRNGYIRAGFHFMNDREEVGRFAGYL